MKVYHGNRWRMRVYGMEDRQVVAIYKHMKASGQLYPHPTSKPKEPGVKKAVQISMFDPEYSAEATVSAT